MEKFLEDIGERKEQAKSVYNNESFEAPLYLDFASGKLIAASDIGSSRLGRNEDRVIVCPETSSFAVIDGMGGYGNGYQMADVLKEELLKEMCGAINERDTHRMHVRASMKMKKYSMANNTSDGGAAYVVCKYYKRELVVARAGDVSVCVVNSKGDEINKLDTTSLRDCPTVFNPGVPKIDNLNCFGGSTIVLGSDGFWDNIKIDDVRDIVSTHNLKDSFDELYRKVKESLNAEFGKKDNVSLVLFRV